MINNFMNEVSEYKKELDNSFEVKWSLQELESIVYDFINAKKVITSFGKQ